MSVLSEKQKRFADEYIISLNATDAYKKAGYKVKSDDVARANASRLLTNANVSAYIEEHLKILEDAKIAKADEVLQTLTRVLRREDKEQSVVILKKPTTIEATSAKGETYEKVSYEEVPEIIELDAKNSDVVRAGEILGKYYKLWTDKVDLNSGDIVIKVGDWDGDADEAED